MVAEEIRRRTWFRIWILGATAIVIAAVFGVSTLPQVENVLERAERVLAELPNWALWVVLALLVAASATWSGSNLGLFTYSRLELKLKSDQGDRRATVIGELRQDSNLLLSTLLWSNVITNVLLTLVIDRILPGIGGFALSVLFITVLGEILPQAIFNRYALEIGSQVVPIVKFARIAVWPLAATSALLIDRIVGPDAIVWNSEKQLQEAIRAHAHDPNADEIGFMEAYVGIRGFAVDDIYCKDEGSPIDPRSVVTLAFCEQGKPQFPSFGAPEWVPFVKQVMSSFRCWTIITDRSGKPCCALDAKDFGLRLAFGENPEQIDVTQFCHELLVLGEGDRLDKVILGWAHSRRAHTTEHHAPHAHDVALFAPSADISRWRIITAADLYAYLTQDAARSDAQ